MSFCVYFCVFLFSCFESAGAVDPCVSGRPPAGAPPTVWSPEAFPAGINRAQKIRIGWGHCRSKKERKWFRSFNWGPIVVEWDESFPHPKSWGTGDKYILLLNEILAGSKNRRNGGEAGKFLGALWADRRESNAWTRNQNAGYFVSGETLSFFSVKKSVLFLYFVLVILDIAQMYFCSVKKVKVYLCIFCVFLLPAVPGEAA